jgi:hypothetical protein
MQWQKHYLLSNETSTMKTMLFRNGRSLVYSFWVFCGSILPASAQLMTSLTFSNLTIGQSYQLQHTFAWYWTNSPVSFTATNPVYTQTVAGAVRDWEYRLAQNPVPAQAFAEAEVFGDFVIWATVTDGGSGYVTAPAVTIKHGGGINATATANVSGGAVSSITITSGGTEYTDTPIIQIAPPPAVAIYPVSQLFMQLSWPPSYTGWRLQYSTSLFAANWQTVPSSSTTNQIKFIITNDCGFFRMAHP